MKKPTLEIEELVTPEKPKTKVKGNLLKMIKEMPIKDNKEVQEYIKLKKQKKLL